MQLPHSFVFQLNLTLSLSLSFLISSNKPPHIKPYPTSKPLSDGPIRQLTYLQTNSPASDRTKVRCNRGYNRVTWSQRTSSVGIGIQSAPTTAPRVKIAGIGTPTAPTKEERAPSPLLSLAKPSPVAPLHAKKKIELFLFLKTREVGPGSLCTKQATSKLSAFSYINVPFYQKRAVLRERERETWKEESEESEST
ncbi:hypothetical protein M8C21_014773, partial [Ambrosia artemisiifolia]